MTAVLVIAAVGAAAVGLLWLGARTAKIDGIVRTVADDGGHGLHVFTRRLHDGGDGDGWWSYHHVFVRFTDGKVWRAPLVEHTAKFATGRMGYDDGFTGFDADVWQKGRWKESLERLASTTGLRLAIAPDAEDLCSDLDAEARPRARIEAAGHVVTAERSGRGHHLSCQPPRVGARAWRVTL